MAIAIPQKNTAYRTKTKGAVNRVLQVLPASILFYSFLIPPEVAFFIGPLRMGSYRIALLICIPYIIYAIIYKKMRFHWLDVVLVTVIIWIPASLSIHYDLATGLEAGGRQSYDMLLAYFLGRCCINSFENLKALMLYILPGLIVAALLLFFESVIGRPFVRQIFQQIFGGAGEVGSELKILFRIGFFRAYSVFSHPIHAGIFLSSFISFYYLLFKNPQWRISGLFVGFFAFFSLSSAGLLGIAMQVALLGYDWLQQKVRDLSWGLIISVMAVMAFLVHVFSQNGIFAVIYSNLTLNPSTGRFRTLIWQYAGDVALKYPWLGIGHEEYERPYWMGTGSIDAHYLFMAVRYGMPSAVLYFFLAVAIIFILSRRVASSATSAARDGFLAMAICLSVTVILMFTVTFWGTMLSWINFMLGAALGLATFRNNLSYGLVKSRSL